VRGWFAKQVAAAAKRIISAMIRLPILKDELAFLEKLLPELETRPDLGHLASAIKARIDKIRQEIRVLQDRGGQY
jgi:hypothetical protein